MQMIKLNVTYGSGMTLIRVNDYEENVGFCKRLEVVLSEKGYLWESEVDWDTMRYILDSYVFSGELDMIIEEQFDPEVIEISYN